MSMRGSIDSLRPDGVSGWLFSATAREPVVVQAILLGRIVGEGAADRHRPDLASAGLGDGCCGFEFSFYEPVDPAMLPLVTVQPHDGNVELPRTDLTGFPEFFRAMQARYPAAGRSRSVFGGLWTDRTDAGQVLTGRVAAGSTAADLEPILRDYIDGGHAVLPSAVAPVGIGPAEVALVESLPAGVALQPQAEPAARRLLEVLPGVLFRDLPLRVLRAILDDNPVACRTTVRREDDATFGQPSTVEGLPSPAECLAVVLGAGEDGVEIDVVRGSHTLPEFTADGRSRWIAGEASAAIAIAIAHGASVETARIGPCDLAIVGPGTLHRVRAPGGSAAVVTWIAPSRQTPLRVLRGSEGWFRVRHASGAALIA